VRTSPLWERNTRPRPNGTTRWRKVLSATPITAWARGCPHCERLAELDTQSATAAGELAAYHQKLAAGAPATAPASGSGFEAGAGARGPTDQELNALAAKASTPANHADLENYFLSLAKRYAADAKTHASMAQLYRSNPRLAGAGFHCDRLVELSQKAASEAAGAAAMHKKLAGY
jgi:hypothetical protein